MRILYPYLSLMTLLLFAQPLKAQHTADLMHIYPIGDDANLMMKTSYSSREKILFEANPIVRYSFTNNIIENLTNGNHRSGTAVYFVFKPQLRMYVENSLPVKMPSYKIQLGYQRIFRTVKEDFITVGIETGHYSNGQSGAAFSEQFADGSSQSDSIYKTITPQTNLSALLNRKNGNFSTDLTELLFSYQFNWFDRDFRFPRNTLTVNAGLNIYHDYLLGIFDIGGYSDNDIKIYGKLRYNFGVNYTGALIKKAGTYKRISLSEKIEIIHGAHPWVKPIRSVTTVTVLPIEKFKQFGIFANCSIGHDDYNFRFVDSGTLWGLGISWSSFIPVEISKRNGTCMRRYQ